MKNQLQEYFQERHWPLPLYRAWRVGGEDHLPEWQAQVEIFWNGEDAQSFTGSCGWNKKEAMQKAAQEAWDFLLSKKEKNSAPEIETKDCIAFLDLENLPSVFRTLGERREVSTWTLVGFCSHTAPHIRKKIEEEKKRIFPSLIVVEIPSTAPDASDVGMVLYLGSLVASSDSSPLLLPQPLRSYASIYIFTEDHFGTPLVECLNRCFLPESSRAYVFRSVREWELFQKKKK